MHMLWHALEIVKQKGIIDTIEYFFFLNDARPVS